MSRVKVNYKVKVGDLVRLHPRECALMSILESELPGLVMAVSEETEPRTVTVLWHGNPEAEEEYEDGLILVNEA